jgi:hypothetical protein
MKLNQLIIALCFSLFSNLIFAQSMDSIPSTQGMNVTKDEQSVFIPVGGKVIIRTESERYKGILESVTPDAIYIDGLAVQTDAIESIKYQSSQRIRNGLIFLISAPVIFAVGIGAAVLWDNGVDGLDFVALGSWLYSPVGLTTGAVLLLTKKKFRLNQGWEMTIDTE